MLKSTTLTEEKNTIQKELRSDRYALMKGGEEDFEQRQGEIRAKYDQIDVLEERIVGALREEDGAAQAAMATNADTSGYTPEMREFHDLGQRCSMAEYMRAGIALRQLPTGTPEHEYNKHVFGEQLQRRGLPRGNASRPERVFRPRCPPGQAGHGAGR